MVNGETLPQHRVFAASSPKHLIVDKKYASHGHIDDLDVAADQEAYLKLFHAGLAASE
jgi:hypothetical protein